VVVGFGVLVVLWVPDGRRDGFRPDRELGRFVSSLDVFGAEVDGPALLPRAVFRTGRLGAETASATEGIIRVEILSSSVRSM